MEIMNEDQIEKIAIKLRNDITNVFKAGTSAFVNALSPQENGKQTDNEILVNEIEKCLEEFKITKESIKRYADDLNVSFEELASHLTFSGDIVLEKKDKHEFANLFVKERCSNSTVKAVAKSIPVVGSMVAGTSAFFDMKYLLDELITSFSTDAKEISEAMSKIREKRQKGARAQCNQCSATCTLI